MHLDEIKKPWILAGYELFAAEGPGAIKVERLARMVNKSKSSFYHHFVDPEIFINFLLDYHLERSKIIAEKEKSCKNVDPELLQVFIEVKEDLLFNRQLRIHRQNKNYRRCFEEASQGVADAILDIWMDTLDLKGDSHLAMLVLKLTIENFYLQITPETLNYQWLSDYVGELKTLVKAFEQKANKSGRFLSNPKLED